MRRSIARGTSQTEQPTQGRHAAGATRTERPRPRGRRRWLVVAAAVAAFSAMIAPPPTPVEADVDDAAAERSTDDGVPTLPELSAGAPAGAITLASAPAHDPDPEPATPAVITGLAANGIPNVALNAYRVAAARMAVGQAVLRDRLVAAGRHRPRRVQPRPLRRRRPRLRRHGDPEDPRSGPERRAVRLHRRQRRRPVGRRHELRPRHGPDAVHPDHLARVRDRRRRQREHRPVQHQRRRPRGGQLPLHGRRQPAHRRRAAARPSSPTTTPTAT